ncbi:uncharacterized protein TRIADDRAFT_55573 [Trichoplax adhaerens]|uniref:Uncharacterized protein n=1 Tax=Trichoplax adhaerens TaxID=10228 RepID=B3RV94_TRIAD|nr:hypothetical protein TRIADDRAFT_55573 [Trichoplax adhaerens]EDV25462.1 hypothetical protein TRIADDRAFT_55573 [Trichoplax adhaerens]|eukprot:XP_002111495.1 hypothetical protein TRIADDRAFT_55573 [Trichoplax adhaerens]
MSQKPNVQIAKSSPEKSSVPRVNMVKSLARPPLMVQDNDDELLDLVARTGGDLGQKREMTGSTARKPVADSYTKEELKVLNQDDDQQRHFKLKRIDDSPSRYGSTNNKLDTSLAASKSVTSPEKTSRIHGRSRVQFADENISAVISPNRGRHFDSEINKTDDPNLKFQDQRQAYTKYISKANFTPAPPEVQDKDAEKTNSRITSKDRIRYDDTLTTVTSPSVGGDTTQVSQPDKSTLENYVALPKVAVEEMLNLVDRYWNGSKSLHRNNKFQGHLEAMLSKYIKTPAAVLEENEQLKAKLHDCIDELSSIRTNYQDKANEIESYRNRLQQQDEIKLVLEKANKDLDLLRSRYEKIKEENASLKSQVGSVESIQQLEMKYQSRLDEFVKENRTLKQELESLKSESSQVHAVNTKIQALTGMLQESHGALVATNRHLLEQLEETKERHQTEVEQLHWSYNQLKKTLSLSDLSS